MEQLGLDLIPVVVKVLVYLLWGGGLFLAAVDGRDHSPVGAVRDHHGAGPTFFSCRMLGFCQVASCVIAIFLHIVLEGLVVMGVGLGVTIGIAPLAMASLPPAFSRPVDSMSR